jgi:hypothetical protein
MTDGAKVWHDKRSRLHYSEDWSVVTFLGYKRARRVDQSIMPICFHSLRLSRDVTEGGTVESYHSLTEEIFEEETTITENLNKVENCQVYK